MHAAANRGEISRETVKEFDRKTDFSHLPERKKDRPHSKLFRKKHGKD